MAKWFYYNEGGEKIEITGGQLKGLAKAGMITPDTIVETEEGKSAPARKIKGLTFVEVVQSQAEESESSQSFFDALPPDEPNPFAIVQPIASSDESTNDVSECDADLLQVKNKQGRIVPVTYRSTFVLLATIAGFVGIHNFYARRKYSDISKIAQQSADANLPLGLRNIFFTFFGVLSFLMGNWIIGNYTNDSMNIFGGIVFSFRRF